MNEENYLKRELYELVKTDERIFEFIQEGSLDGLWYWDLENPENEWMNTRFWKVLGYDPGLMPHKSSAWQDIINQDDLEIALDNFNKHCENPDHPYDQIVRYTHKMGHTIWIRCRGMAIRDEQGKPIRMIGAHQDITDLKNVEKELIKAKEKAEEKEKKLKHSHDLFQYIIEHTRSAVAVHDKDYRYLYVSDKYVKEYGLDEVDILGKHHYDVFPNLPQKWREAHKRALEGEISSAENDPYYRDDGTVEWTSWECRPWYESDDSIGGFIVYTDVITKQKELDLELKKAKISENRFKVLSEIAEELIWEVDTDGRYTYVSPVIESMLGYRPDEIVGKKYFYDLFYTTVREQQRVEALKIISEKKEIKNFRNTVMHKDGHLMYLNTSGSPIFEDGNFIGYSGVDIDITDLTIAEEKNEEILQRFELISKHIPGLIYQYRLRPDGTTHFPYASSGIYNVFGLKPDEVKYDASNVLRLVHPEDVELVQSSTSHSAETLTTWQEVFRVNLYSGKTIWVQGEGTPLKMDDGSVVWYGHMQDITERKMAEEALRESETRFKEILKNIKTVAVQGYTMDGTVTYWNDASARFYGYSEDEALGKNLLDLIIPPEMKTGVKKEMEKMAKTEKAIPSAELPLMRKNGSRVNVFSSHSYVKVPGKEPEMFCIDVDLSQRKKAEEKLKLFNRALEASSVSVVITDANGDVEYMNPFFTEITGYTLEEVRGENLNILESREQNQAFNEELWSTIHSGKDWSGEFLNKKKNGELFWEKAVISPIKSADTDQITHFVAIREDITELLEKEDQLKKSLKEKEVLLAEIHHRVKNNLAVVSGMMQLQSSDEEDPVIKEKLSDSISRIKTIAKIHEKLYQNESFASIDLSENIRDLTFENINSLSAGKKIEVVASMEPVILNINEAVPCSLIINEVLVNALKHAFINKINGIISVSVSEHQDLVKVIITDNGIGLPENFMRKNYSSGTMIIQVLTEQLEGESKYRRIKTGTKFVLQFQKTAVTESLRTNKLGSSQ